MTPSSPSDAVKGRWPVTLTTERANPLRQWNPGRGGCSTARRPVAAVSKLFLRRPVFVKRFTREMTAGSVGSEARTTRHGVARRTSIASQARTRDRDICCSRLGHVPRQRPPLYLITRRPRLSAFCCQMLCGLHRRCAARTSSEPGAVVMRQVQRRHGIPRLAAVAFARPRRGVIQRHFF